MASKKKPNVHDLLNKFENQENEFLQKEFLAPALRGGSVGVRIAGATCEIKVQPADFHGWGVFQPQSHTLAKLVREATLSERRDYLKLFPQIRMHVCRRIGTVWFGSAASFGDSRIKLEGITPISFASEIQMFDCIRTRYDGNRFWFEEIDSRADPTMPVYLREAISERIEPEELQKSGLSAEQRAAYELNFWELTGREQPESNSPVEHEATETGWRSDSEDPVRKRLRESLSHAGAELVDYLERDDSCRVSFSVGGQQFTSSVNTSDLSVQVAGICLSGQDQKFDLGSLVGVLREGSESGEIVREY